MSQIAFGCDKDQPIVLAQTARDHVLLQQIATPDDSIVASRHRVRELIFTVILRAKPGWASRKLGRIGAISSSIAAADTLMRARLLDWLGRAVMMLSALAS
ncbi:hypothetical protein [Neorhizobium sp. T6_25]|uniref:hypothetical protein n=1 Tax=Neorhizobium sp. T6_25 TaxID=2093833 RepID=UPI001FDFF376|nr:hypothetical protein [Neorhizobium sp. T6_25]